MSIIYFLIEEDINGEVGEMVFSHFAQYIEAISTYPFLDKYKYEVMNYFNYSGNTTLFITNKIDLIIAKSKEPCPPLTVREIYVYFQREATKEDFKRLQENYIYTIFSNIQKFIK